MFHLRSKVIQLVHGVSIHNTHDPSFSLCTVVLVSAGLFYYFADLLWTKAIALIGTRVHNACVPVCVSLFMFDFLFVCVFLPLCAMSKY